MFAINVNVRRRALHMKMESMGGEADRGLIVLRVCMVKVRVHTIGRQPYKEEDLISI